MPVINRVADLVPEIAQWRQDFHEHPELLFDVNRTAAIVAEKLTEFGCDEIVTGIARTGVVAIIQGRETGSGKRIALRADMDALPLDELGDLPYKSKVPGKMHACGHDGHTAMLLGAARYLAETRNFDGTAVLIFQPAEEGGGGGKMMLDEGIMERFAIDEAYGMHNMPGIPVGAFAIRAGAMMAAADRFKILVQGKGTHAAMPHQGTDTILASCHLVTALHSIVSRNVDPLEAAVVSVGRICAGETFNVLPQQAEILGTVRTLSPKIRDDIEIRVRSIADHVAATFGATVEVDYMRGYPVLMNDAASASFMQDAACDVAGSQGVDGKGNPIMGSEDFAFMLEERPGAYIFLGNGDSAALHHPAYDFNDAAIPYGVSLWARLIEKRMPV
ncbi:M20 aminoacylase family protein [Microvirga lotononidis]|uniref:Amidohydrolase n=1 Tax=Microvirga lotononidis TaxID=864069 RepID=I4YYG7_9HYPH|nr:M20 aminoacylase family protein [Microvirga lotononidis]EIM29009.1 amidohydrolase [Microvirga lotononidis]WQO31305.1 M20 aminoacylase family protein [Microvirga lotononidis]